MIETKTFHPSTVRAGVVQAFYQSDFQLDPKVYKCTQIEVINTGKRIYDSMVSYAGVRNWKYFLRKSPLKNPEDTFIRVAGYGHLLTEYFVAPVRPLLDNYELVCEMGCLTNMIVSTYDHALDHRLTSNRNLLSRELLENLLNDSPDLNSWFALYGKSRISKVLIGLIRRYVEILNQLSINKQIANELINRIYSMYEAETATTSIETMDMKKLHIKSSYPFILMGMIPWLSINENDSTLYRWHKSWLSEIGAVFGMIDDVVDLKEDMVSGQPNQLLSTINLLDDETQINILANELIQKCLAIQGQWTSKLNDMKVKEAISYVFATCVFSWLGH